MSKVLDAYIRFEMLMAFMRGSVVFTSKVVLGGVFNGRRRSRRSRDEGKGQAVMAVVALVLAALAPLLASIIQLAVSRQREYLADASAVELTRNPAGLVSALRKLTGDPNELEGASRGTQHLYIVNPLRKNKKGRDSIFSTHPSLESRIERIEGLSAARA